MDTKSNHPPKLWKVLPKISAREIERHVKAISNFGPRPEGSKACQLAGDYIESEFQRSDLNTYRLPLQFEVLENLNTSIEVELPVYRDFRCEGHLRTGLTPDEGLSGPLIHLGKAFPEDFLKRDLKGKFLLAFEDIPFEGNGPSGIRYFGERVRDAYEAGALGIIFADYRPDNLIMTWGVMRDLAPIPCLAVSYPDYCELRHFAESSECLIHIMVTAKIHESQSDVISAGVEGPGERPIIIVLGTHYETVPTCVGANDNASSLGILLELARVFTHIDLSVDLLFIASTGEEAGSFGAIEYVRKHRHWLEKRAIAAIAFDQVGGNDVPLSAQGTPSLNRLMIKEATALGYKLRRDDDPEFPLRTGLSDVQPFFDLGIPSVYLGGWASDLFYHTKADTIDKLNPNALKVLADIIAASILRLAKDASAV
jgi:aminopeptidase YwaD